MLRYPANSVVIVRKQQGRNVIHAYLARPILMTSVVPTANATTASNWLATPKSGQIELMLPVQMKYDQDTTMMMVDSNDAGSQSVRPNGFHTRPPNSCSTNLPMRVPESIVVRMNTASNMIAK